MNLGPIFIEVRSEILVGLDHLDTLTCFRDFEDI